MLVELPHVSQVPNDYVRRCFADENLKLVIWYKPGQAIYGFQFCYDLNDNPRALTWLENKGFSHAEIDDGEQSPLANRSPILRPNDNFDGAALLACFQSTAEKLPPLEKEFVQRKLAESAHD